jgi:hypothetical protein
VADTKIDRYYYNDDVVRFFESGNADDLARVLLDLINNRRQREIQVREALRFVEFNDWTANQHIYLELVDRLAGKSRDHDPVPALVP